jgi:hypothetical protein
LERNVIFVGDTGDVGMSVWLYGEGGGVGKRFVGGPDSEEVEEHEFRTLSRSSSDLPADARLDGTCHCGGVHFQILRPAERKGYTAGIDTCTSCRLTTGFELTFWTSVPLNNVQMPDGSPLDLSARNSGTLKCYNSSKGVYRYFCGACGAAAFIAKDEQSWVGVAAGLLRAEEGVRAERWLDWKEIGFAEEATDQELVRALEKGFRT